MKNNREKRILYLTVFLWVVLVSGLGWWNVAQIKKADQTKNLESARSLFETIVTTREWNSRLGGVYVPVSDDIQPNPYLDMPDREITSTSGMEFTKINPAYMTRLISEIAEENDNVTYHITSLNPIRPANAADSWEKEALTLFESSTETETSLWNKQDRHFRYMDPLYVQESCMPCHEKQGYKVGDIRGGISVSFPAAPTEIWPVILSYVVILNVGFFGLLYFGNQMIVAFNRLEQQTEIDGLTQINNRYYFDKNFHREYLRARRSQSPLSVLICDIDDFKTFNDTYGHQMGDTCLKSVAQALHQVLHRPGDLVARYGGEEFGILLPDTTSEGAYAISELLRARVESLGILHVSSRIGKFVTISIGVATSTGEEGTQELLLKNADIALYKAKARGKNMVIMADPENAQNKNFRGQENE